MSRHLAREIERFVRNFRGLSYWPGRRRPDIGLRQSAALFRTAEKHRV